jgi:peptide deformylase
MSVRTVLTWPNPRLKNIASPIKAIDEEVIKLARDMRDTMHVEFGVGLAATQVGSDRALVVLKVGDASINSDPLVNNCIVLVNPKIEVLGAKTFRWPESCLSVTGIEEIVKRYQNIRLTYTDLAEEEHIIELSSENAGLVQHEVDHLFGKLFIDRLKSIKRRRVLQSLGNSLRIATLTRIKEEKRAKLEEQENEEVRPGFRVKSSLKNSSRKRFPKKFGKNKRRRKK